MASSSPPPPPNNNNDSNNNSTPILTLSKVIIRPYLPTDAPSAAQQGNDPTIARYMRDTFPSPYTLQDAERFINEVALGTAGRSAPPLHPGGVPLHYALCRPGDGAFMGGIGLKPLADVEARTLELGYWVGRGHRGRGCATEAVAAFSRWAFAAFPAVLRLEAAVFEGNGASEAVLRKAGYQREGVRRKAIWKHGGSWDQMLFGMLREECPGLERGEEEEEEEEEGGEGESGS